MLLYSAKPPTAVFKPPVVLLKSAPAPIAVFWSAVLANSADSRIKAVGRVAAERKETNGRIKTAGGKAKQGILPFRRIPTGVAPVWWWADGVCCRGKCKACEGKRRECKINKFRHCFHIIFQLCKRAIRSQVTAPIVAKQFRFHLENLATSMLS